ncbi:MAG: endonuclease [Roseibium sp.]|uniref:endonuclease/exonuclease/phosphatase family protein n=1 Tax=Roseibium sp. TaxID=1936156 RepID=UPI001B0266CD|nr:endonuclease/exonuclease/phosphatase family protein [Roseibium sp.]MBO6895216.1 endonuclease [Roseibium sp.]MBO6932337.1 endonuclease [Roseibium sp.]
MPFYTKLSRSHPDDPDKEAVRKRTIAGIRRLRVALKDHFPDNTDRMKTVRIGTWNIREFGGNKYGGRDSYEPIYYMAEIISNFDIVALQEVRGDLAELHRLLKILGPDWDYIATDVTDGRAGNGERMVFAFNRSRARFRNIAGELTLPSGKKVLASFGERIRLEDGLSLQLPAGTDLSGVYRANSNRNSSGVVKLDNDVEIPLPTGARLDLPEGASLAVTRGTVVTRPPGTRGEVQVNVPQGAVAGEDFRLRFPGGALDESFRQFARTPYVVSFQANWLKIDLATVHIYFGSNEDERLLAQRRREIEQLTEALGDRASKEMKDDPKNPVLTAVLGDFNIISAEHETMGALEANGFEVPEKIRTIPGTNVKQDKAYDQIAFWEPRRNRGYVNVEILDANVFDFFDHVYRLDEHANYAPERSEQSYKTWRTYKMSDHLPLWVELTSDFSDEYIDACDTD